MPPGLTTRSMVIARVAGAASAIAPPAKSAIRARDAARMKAAAGAGYSTATDLADWLVRELKMPFREAHHVTGRIVAAAERKGVALEDLPLAAMQEIEPRITSDALKVLSVERSVASRVSMGGTAPANVRREATKWLKRLGKK